MRDGRIFLSIGIVSAALAALVPGVLDPASAPVSAGAQVVVELPVSVEPAPVIAVAALAPAPPAIPQPADPDPSASETVRRDTLSPVPPGCERLVSPLARSVASRTIGRCIT